MQLTIHAHLDYRFVEPTHVLLQVEAAATDGQRIVEGHLDIDLPQGYARVAGHDGVGERIWLTTGDRLAVDYRATVAIERPTIDWPALAAVPLAQLPAETVQHLLPSRYSQPELFERFVKAEFARLEGGALILAMRDWIARNFAYTSGISTDQTTAAESFARREGVCRDYAHVLITLARTAGIPARIASVYAPGVDPPDFHAVAQLYLDGAWHLADATGMASEADMAIIGVGRDAADVSFLTAFGTAQLWRQTVEVRRSPDAP